MQKKNIPRIQEATNNTTTEQVKAKIFIFLWILMFVVVMVLSIALYDPEHKILFTLLPIAMAFPCAIKVNKNVRRLNEEKEREKILIRRDADANRKTPAGTNRKKK